LFEERDKDRRYILYLFNQKAFSFFTAAFLVKTDVQENKSWAIWARGSDLAAKEKRQQHRARIGAPSGLSSWSLATILFYFMYIGY